MLMCAEVLERCDGFMSIQGYRRACLIVDFDSPIAEFYYGSMAESKQCEVGKEGESLIKESFVLLQCTETCGVGWALRHGETPA